MRQLLGLIQTALSGVIDRDMDIILTPDKDLIPAGLRFPCIGIKDGQVEISELMGDVLEKSLPVEIYFYNHLETGDDTILLFHALGEDISSRLRDNDLSGYVKSVSPVSESPVRVMYTKQGPILQKGLYFQYEREE